MGQGQTHSRGDERGEGMEAAGRGNRPVDNAGKRLMGFALESDIHDERLWMPIAKATGALGNTSCLVGTPEQVAESILKYYRLGIGSFLIRGFDPMNDAPNSAENSSRASRPAPPRSTA